MFREIVARADVLAQSPPDDVAKAYNGHLRFRTKQYFDEETIKKLMRQVRQKPPVSIPDMVRGTFDAFRDFAEKPHIFVKENYISHVGAQVLDIYPDARFVFQTRDPRDYLASAVKMRERRFGNKFGSLRNAMDLWAQDQTFGLRLLGQLGPERVFFQRYEDLIEESESVLSSLCRFVGVEFHPEMLQFYEGKAAKQMADANSAMALLAQPVVTANSNKFDAVLAPRQVKRVEAMVGPLMDQLGYERAYSVAQTSRRRHLVAVSLSEPIERWANSVWSPFYRLLSVPHHDKLTKMIQPVVGRYARAEDDKNYPLYDPQQHSVAHRLLRSAQTHPDRPAIKIDGVIWTYDQLFGMARRGAQDLQDTYGKNLPPIGVYVERRLATYVSILAVFLAGGCYVPLNPNLPTDRIRKVMADAGVKVVLHGDDVPSAFAQLVAEMPSITAQAIVPGARPALTKFTALDVAPDQVAYVLFTSGSTGNPKGVLITQANLNAYLDEVIATLAPSAQARFSQCFDLAFDPSIHDILVSLSSGAMLCVPSPSDLVAPAHYIQRDEITHLFAVPSLMYAVRQVGGLTDQQFPSLKMTIFGGEPLSAGLAKAWQIAAPNSAIENWYGPTEVTIACTRHVWRDEPLDPQSAYVPIGKPFTNARALVVDGALNEVAPGEVGRLLVSGAQIAKGYVNDPTRTAERFLVLPEHEGVFYDTGDMVRTLGDDLYFVGRTDGQVKIRGRRGEIGEVEAALHGVAQGDNVIAVSWPQNSANPTHILAAIERNEIDLSLDWDALRAQLPDYMVPTQVVALASFARNPSGKVDRKAVASQIADCLAPDAKARAIDTSAKIIGETGFAKEVFKVVLAVKPALDQNRLRNAPSLLWAGLDSLDFVDLTVGIETDLNITLDANKVSEMADKSFAELVQFLEVLRPMSGKVDDPSPLPNALESEDHWPARMNRSAEFVRAFPDVVQTAQAPMVIVLGQSGVYRGFSAQEAQRHAAALGQPITALNLGLPGLNANGLRRMCEFLRDTCLARDITPLAIVYELDPMGVSVAPPTHDLDVDERIFDTETVAPIIDRPAGNFRWDMATHGDLKFNKAKWDKLRQPKWERERDHVIWEYYNGTLNFDPERVATWLEGARALTEMPTRVFGFVHPVRGGRPPNAKAPGPLFDTLVEQVRSTQGVELMTPDDFELEDADFFNVNHVEVGHGRPKLTQQIVNYVLKRP
jgi:amino acid adenylation domain-containing protein